MKEILNFCLENYRLIADVVAIILAVVFFILKKNPVNIYDTLGEIILKSLPVYINKAESLGVDGREKLNYVVQRILSDLDNLGYKDCFQYVDFITDSVESILSTPQKKNGGFKK